MAMWLIGFAFTGCRGTNPGHSSLYLDSGYLDSDGKAYPGVYGLAVDPAAGELAPGKFAPTCTATAISPTVLVTAAHCLVKSAHQFIYAIIDFDLSPLRDGKGEILRGEAIAHPSSRFASGNSWRQSHDLAFIRVTKPSFSTFYSFIDRDPSPGENVQLVGYGVKRGSPSAGRQYGNNKLVTLLKEGSLDPLGHPVRSEYFSLYQVTFDRALNTDPNHPLNSGTVPGDSGGPLFIGNKLAGILYGGAYWNQQRDEDNDQDRGRFDDSVYVNPRATFHREFIDSLRTQGWDIPLL